MPSVVAFTYRVLTAQIFIYVLKFVVSYNFQNNVFALTLACDISFMNLEVELCNLFLLILPCLLFLALDLYS